MKNFDEWRIPPEPGTDTDVDAFLTRRYTSAMYADHVWQAEIAELVEDGIAVPMDSDHDHVKIEDISLLDATRKGERPWRKSGRFKRRILRAMSREHERTGCIRTHLGVIARFEARQNLAGDAGWH
jgi:hypothetical protein